jgi:PKD repeat protein
MRKLTIILGILLFLGIAHQAIAQKDIDKGKTSNSQSDVIDYKIDNMGYWMKMARKGLVQYNPDVAIPPAIFKGSKIQSKLVQKEYQNSPDIPVTTLSTVTESENSVFIDPDDNMYLLNSNNSTEWTGSTVGNLLGANFFQSSNAGAIWGGSPNGAGGANSGDPATAINHAGRQFVNYIDDPGGQGIAYSDNGTTWSTATIAANPGDLADKNHMWIDNKTTSPYVGNLYTAWTDFGGTYDYQVVLSRSTNNGLTWSSKIPISGLTVAPFNHGVNVQTGPLGQVYVCWATYASTSTITETGIGFSKSLDGGATFNAAANVISNIKGIRSTGVLKNMRVNSFPVMAVDISEGPNKGNIYIVWTNIGTPGTNTGTNKSVYLIRSTNGGTTWSTPIRVNQGTFADGKESYSPWITCDPETGNLSVVFYDDRNTASTACEAWVSVSLDAGNTWSDFRVSDVSFTPTAIPGLASSYMGDYLGITSKGGRVYPCWTDTRGGEFKTYVSPFVIGLNASFTASATTVCTGTSVTFTDHSSGPPTSWQWSFPGGTPSSYTGIAPPAITYNTPGIYNVTLVVTDATGTDTEVKTGFITVANVFADFSATPVNVVVGNSVTFTDLSGCSPTSWVWSFPGGTPGSYSGQTPPAITYSTLGTYNVSLTATKGASSDVETKTGYITVSPPEFNMADGSITTCTGNFYDPGGPSASYSNSQTFTETFYPSTPGAMIRFNFSSFATESGYDYLRIYNGTSTAATLIGTYSGTTGPGIVTASNASGALTFNFTSDISLTYAGWTASISCYSNTDPPVAAFTASSTTPAINSTVTFTDQTTNIPTSWLWSITPNTFVYVGSTSATSQNPQVQFTALGQYSVTLTATNANGSDGEIKTNYINVIPYTYCIPTYTTGTSSNDYITLVQLGTINNATGASASPYYTYYSSLSTNLTPGSAYTITLSPGTYASSNYIAVWIDYNQNGVFETTEKLGNILAPPTPATSVINFTVPAGATAGTTRMRVREVYSNTSIDPCASYTYGEAEDYNVNILSLSKSLNLTVFLEGLFNGSTMNKAQNATGNQFPGLVADQITVELHNSTSPYAIAGGPYTVNINTDGTASVTIPASLGASYYVVIKHRNSIETWNATPLSFAGSTMSYNFSTAAEQAFGNNQKLISGKYVIFGGDVNQDGIVDSGDMAPVDNLSGVAATGYLPEDTNGDGLIDSGDMASVDNNSSSAISKIVP